MARDVLLILDGISSRVVGGVHCKMKSPFPSISTVQAGPLGFDGFLFTWRKFSPEFDVNKFRSNVVQSYCSGEGTQGHEGMEEGWEATKDWRQ